MDRKEFAARLRSARHAAGLTQAEVAKRSGVDPRRLTDYESGLHVPAVRFWPALAEAVGIPLDAFFAPEGWAVLPTPLLRPETLVAMRDPEGFERVYELVCARIREAMLVAKPLEPVPAGRRRRSREDVILRGHKPRPGSRRGGG